jgi:hypothetical protein
MTVSYNLKCALGVGLPVVFKPHPIPTQPIPTLKYHAKHELLCENLLISS